MKFMNEKKISSSFAAQGLMETLGAKLALVADGAVHIELPFSRHLSQQHGFAGFNKILLFPVVLSLPAR